MPSPVARLAGSVLLLTAAGGALTVGVGLLAPVWVSTLVGVVVGTNCLLLAVGVAQLDRAQERERRIRRDTAAALRSRPGWRVERRTGAEGHEVAAVVTPHAVAAVVVVRHRVTSPAGVRRRLRADRDTARKASAALGPVGPHAAPPVPVLVVWGPGSEYLPDGSCEVDGVWELAGGRPECWPERLDRPEHRAPVVVLHPATTAGEIAARAVRPLQGRGSGRTA